MPRLRTVAAALRRFPSLPRRQNRSFRSQAALDTLESHVSSNKSSTLVLYNYPSFSGAYAALFAHRLHSLLRLPALLLPFSSVEPLRLEDFEYREGLETCYLLDFIGPRNFALELARIVPRVVAFDHRQSSAARISHLGQIPENLELHVDTTKSSARAVHDYFLKNLAEAKTQAEENVALLEGEDGDRVANVLRYTEDVDLRRFELPDIKAFKVGIREEMARLNCVTNPLVFEQLLELDCGDLIAKGKSYASLRQNAAIKLLGNAFKIRLGRGEYGECLVLSEL